MTKHLTPLELGDPSTVDVRLARTDTVTAEVRSIADTGVATLRLASSTATPVGDSVLAIRRAIGTHTSPGPSGGGGMTIGRIQFEAHDGTSYAIGSQIIAREGGVWSGTSHPMIFQFGTCAPGSTTVTTRGRFAAEGAFQLNAGDTPGTVERFRVNDATTTDNSAAAIISADSATDVPLVVQADPSQTENLTEWQDSAGNVLSHVDNIGTFWWGDRDLGVAALANEDIEPCGFVDRTQSTITLTPGSPTDTFEIAPTGTDFDVWVAGNRFTVTGGTQAIAHTTGNTFVYYDANGDLVQSSSPWDLFTTAPVALIYYSAAAAEAILLEERHGLMDTRTHYYLHNSEGSRYRSGLTLADYTVQPASPADSDNRFSISSGTMADEDIVHAIGSLAAGGPYHVMRRTGTSEWTWSQEDDPYIVTGSYIAYNSESGGTWSQTALANNNYVNYYVLAAGGEAAHPQHYVLQGQSVYTTLVDAVAESPLSALLLDAFAFAEAVLRYKVTFRTAAAYTTTGKCRIAAVEQLVGQAISLGAAVIPTNHATLSGRDLADQHPASAITNTPSGDIAATNVQSALNELDTEKAALAGATLTGTYTSDRALSTDVSYATLVTADAFNRFEIDADGTQAWGDGASATDISVARTSAGQLTIDGTYAFTDGTAVHGIDIDSSINAIRVRRLTADSVPSYPGRFLIQSYANTSAARPAQFYMATARGTAGSETDMLSDDLLGQFASMGWGNSAYRAQSFITFRAAENWGASARGSRAVLNTTPVGSTTAAITLTGIGLAVGIGTDIHPVASANERLRVGAPTTLSTLATAQIGTSATTAVGLSIQGLASQTADLQRWANSAGTVLGGVSAAGLVFSGTAPAVASSASVGPGYVAVGSNAAQQGAIRLPNNPSGHVGAIDARNAANTSDVRLLYLDGSDNVAIAAGGDPTYVYARTQVGTIATPRHLVARDYVAIANGAESTNIHLSIEPTATTRKPLQIKEIASQTAYDLDLLDSGGTSILRIKPGGLLHIGPAIGSSPSSLPFVVHAAHTNYASWSNAAIVSTDSYAIDKGGSLVMGGQYSSGGGLGPFARIAGLKETATDGEFGGYFAVGTREHGASMSEKFRVRGNGNILLYNGADIEVGGATGNSFGAATTSKVGKWGFKAVQPTGWGTPTGTLTRTTFDTTTVTLSQLAERLAALISDLKGTGELGA